MVKKKTIEEIIKELRNQVLEFNDNEETTTEKHQIWSLKKTLILHDYIKPFLTILRNYNYKKIHYHDLFSGTGFLKINGKIMPGTPLVSLLTTKELTKERKDLYFDSVHFSDKEMKSIKLLEGRVNTLKGNLKTNIITETGTFKKITYDVFSGFQPIKEHRYDDAHLVILDPYGFDVEWEFLQRILKSGAVDVILTFPSKLANWTKTMPNSKSKLTKMFGSDEYENLDSAEEFVTEYCYKIQDIPVDWRLKTQSMIVEAGMQTYHLICISRSDGAFYVFRDLQKKFDSITTDQLEGMFNSATGGSMDQYF